MSKPLTRRDLANIPACLLKIKAGNTSIAYLDGSWIIGTRFAEFSRLFTIGFLSLHKVDLNIKNVRIWWGDKGGDKLKYFALTCLPRIYIMDVGIDSQGQNYRISIRWWKQVWRFVQPFTRAMMLISLLPIDGTKFRDTIIVNSPVSVPIWLRAKLTMKYLLQRCR